MSVGGVRALTPMPFAWMRLCEFRRPTCLSEVASIMAYHLPCI